jgi:hypothetical protein
MGARFVHYLVGTEAISFEKRILMRYRTRGLGVSFRAIVLFGTFYVMGKQPANAIDLPAAGINSVGYSYYGTALPFVDVAHMAGRWFTMNNGTLVNPTDTQQQVRLSQSDYPTFLDPGQIARTLIFTNNGGIYPTGLYTLQWQGSGNVQVGGPGVSVVSTQPQQVVYRVDSTSPAGLTLDITKTDPANPVKNISLHSPLAASPNGVFNLDYEKDIANYGVIRMGWNEANNSAISKWSDRTTPANFHWGGGTGVPYEYQIKLSNELHEDLWLSVPHQADDDYIRNLGQLVQQQLQPGLRVWIEYSNEVWNHGFQQAAYADNVLRPKYGVADSAEAYGRRAAEIFDVFSSQFTNPTDRVVRVIAWQTGNKPGLEESLKGATVDGKLKADVAAIAPYFRVDTDQLYQEYLQGTVDLKKVFADLQTAVDSSMQLAADSQKVAASHGLPLVTYEGGQHLVARPGEQHNDQGFVDLLTAINRDDRMGPTYTYMLDQWKKIGGSTFIFAGDVYASGKWGSWGLQENYLDTNSPKFKAVQKYFPRARTSPLDFNKDGAIDIRDYYFWRKIYGMNSLGADANGDGSSDGADYVLLRKYAGLKTAVSSSGLIASRIPEPSTMILAFGLIAISFVDGRRFLSRA